jgi:16S rRNA G966 N2-methylase RsmD
LSRFLDSFCGSGAIILEANIEAGCALFGMVDKKNNSDNVTKNLKVAM